jgi:RND family efflux transporter MFP subunit
MKSIFKTVWEKKWLVLILLMIVVAVSGWKIYTNQSAAKKVATHTVKRQNLSETLSLSGEIAAEENVVLRFQTSGYLTWVGVKEGDFVKKFQTVASLDQEELQKNLKKYLNTYMSERWDFDVDKKNYDTRITSDLKFILDKAQFDLDKTVWDVEIKNLAIKYANLWTPIEGIVISADSPTAGVNITPTQAEFQIINPKTIYFLATADQTDVVGLTTNQSGKIILDPFPDQEISSQITNISFSPKSGETGTVYEVKMSLPLTANRLMLRLGMTGDAQFITKELPNVLAVPTKFVKTDKEGLKYVWLKDGKNKKKWVVTLGDTLDSQVEIKSGLEEGNIISE